MDKNELSELKTYFDQIYVQKDDCNERHERTEKEINEIAVSQGKISAQLTFLEKISMAELTAVIGLLISAIGKVIFK